jgi:hypothetical protein
MGPLVKSPQQFSLPFKHVLKWARAIANNFAKSASSTLKWVSIDSPESRLKHKSISKQNSKPSPRNRHRSEATSLLVADCHVTRSGALIGRRNINKQCGSEATVCSEFRRKFCNFSPHGRVPLTNVASEVSRDDHGHVGMRTERYHRPVRPTVWCHDLQHLRSCHIIN